MARTIDVVSLYPKDMNIYGDSGNVLTIRRRLELYGYEPVVHQYNQGDDWPAALACRRRYADADDLRPVPAVRRVL